MSSVPQSPTPPSSSLIPNNLQLNLAQTHHHIRCQALDKNPTYSYFNDQTFLSTEFSNHVQHLKVLPSSTCPKINEDHKLHHCLDGGQRNGVIRVCSDCRTTTTPLWRSGPQGPKSLCNACGIRQRKARRAAMETVERRSVASLPLKKRSKIIDDKYDENYGLSSRNNKDYLMTNCHYFYHSKKRALTTDEEEGALLLMALSCGLASSS